MVFFFNKQYPSHTPSAHTLPQLPFSSDSFPEAQGGNARATMGHSQERGQWMSPADAKHLLRPGRASGRRFSESGP